MKTTTNNPYKFRALLEQFRRILDRPAQRMFLANVEIKDEDELLRSADAEREQFALPTDSEARRARQAALNAAARAERAEQIAREADGRRRALLESIARLDAKKEQLDERLNSFPDFERRCREHIAERLTGGWEDPQNLVQIEATAGQLQLERMVCECIPAAQAAIRAEIEKDSRELAQIK